MLFLIANFARRSSNLGAVELNLIVPFFAMDMRDSADFGPLWTGKLLSLLKRVTMFSVSIRSTAPIMENKVLIERGAPPSGAALIIIVRKTT